MDADETHLDPSSRENISRQPTDWPLLNSSTTSIEDKQLKRKVSLRVRPTQYLENAEPPSPLNVSLKSASIAPSAKMSLFHLFSRPKVERQRGYAEKGVDVPSMPIKRAAASTPNLLVQVQPPLDGSRANTPMSLPNGKSKPPPKITFKEPLPRDAAERRQGMFEPPPLFQAYPQSMKEGTVEVSDMTPEAALHKSKGKKSKGDEADEGQSQKTKRSGKSSFKHVANGASVNVELPRKVFVLVTSGYLLQYAETGPSDRLPEKMLHLGKDSAAFACDLLPGKHYVLQVSQAVDNEGVIVASSSSIFSKLGIRSAASKKMTNGFLLVMPNAAEFQSWMTAIRQEIENLGGKKFTPDAAVRPKTGTEDDNLSRVPSQSHRYQVKRNPSKVTNVTSPTQATFMLPSPTQSTFMIPSPTLAAFPAPSPSRSPKIEEEPEESDTATIDGIDMEASKLEEDRPDIRKPSPRKRATSDAPSIDSSAAMSLEHQQLHNIRNSLSNSTRTSHTSQAGTVVTVGTSRTNSLIGSPPSPGFLTGSLESQQDNVAPMKPPYRPMASAGYSVNRRRSAVPLPTPREGQTLPSLNTSPAKPNRQSAIEESPVAGHFPSPPKIGPVPSRLATAQSEPNLKARSSAEEKHDVPLPPPPAIPAADSSESGRPESFVGDLPPPSTWSATRAPSRRTSMMQTSPSQSPVPQPEATRSAEFNRSSKRMSFSMPLKVNPSTPNSSDSPPTNVRRRSQMGAPDPAGEVAIVHTLTAKVDSAAKRVSISQYQPPLSLASQDGQLNVSKRASVTQFSRPLSISSQPGLQRTPSGQRLSLFPNQISLPNGGQTEPPKRSSSAMAQTTYAQPTGQARTLRRPTSMQVRSDHAPFLQSVRNSTGPPDGRAVPIRGMKPSRSASNVAALANQTQTRRLSVTPSSSTPPASAPAASITGFNFTPILAEGSEETDRATPLPDMDRTISPLPTSRPASRTGSRKGLSSRSSLPVLDLGMPVVGLGPPAPPPSAPLPAPPPGVSPASSPPASRTTSPSPAMQVEAPHVGIDTVAGLGIRVS